MIRDAASGKFQYIIVYMFDRLARNRRDSIIYKEMLKGYCYIQGSRKSFAKQKFFGKRSNAAFKAQHCDVCLEDENTTRRSIIFIEIFEISSLI